LTTLGGRIGRADYTFDPEWWGPVSAAAQDVIAKCLVVDQDRRLTPQASTGMHPGGGFFCPLAQPCPPLPIVSQHIHHIFLASS